MHSMVTESLDETISIEEAHCRIDEAIAKYQDTISALKSHRNRYAPISHLPPEIISRIFSFVKIQYFPYGGPYSMKWFKLTHVTRHWRNIAINSPSLWVDLPVENLPWVEEMLRRSKDASLVINYNFVSNHRILPGLALALKHTARARDLSFRKVTSNVWVDLQKCLPESAPRLERLTLDGYPSVPNQAMSSGIQSSEPISITGPILCETGRLRHLELSNCSVNWESHSHILHSLTHLKLHNLSQPSRPNWKHFVDILKGMPNLKYLDLQDALPAQTSERAIWPTDHIHFTSLQTLNIRSTNNELQPFFSCVTFPSTATVNVTCSATDAVTSNLTFATDFSDVILNIGRSFANCSFAPIFQSLILRRPEQGSGIQFELYTDVFHDLVLDPKFIPGLKLAFLLKTGISAELIIEKLLLDIFDGALHLQHVKRVYLADLAYNINGETIAITVGKLPSVRFVMVQANRAGGPFLNALKLCSDNADAGPSTSDPTSKLYFPCLSSICLREIHFDDSDDLTVDSLHDTLVQRSECGAGIKKLTLYNCSRLGTDDVGLLAETVDNVDWDEREIFTDSEENEDGCPCPDCRGDRYWY